MQVRTPSLQHEVMIEAVENHMPQVIVIDEIGTELEAQAARTIAERGVQLIGTAHGNNLDNLMLNPTLSDLIGGIQSVTLGDEEARRRRTQKSVLERKAPPTFDVIVEIQDRERVVVHADVADTVDAMLRGDQVAPELRWRDEEGRPPVPGPAAAVAPRAARRGAVRRAGRDRLAVADGARLARRRRVPDGGYREADRGGSFRPGYRPGRVRRLAPDPWRIGPRDRASARPDSEGGASGVMPGERFAVESARRGRPVRRRRDRRSRAAGAGRHRLERRDPRPRGPRARAPEGLARPGVARAQRAQGRGGHGSGQRGRARR